MGTEKKIICSRYFVRRLQLGKRVRIDEFLSFFLKYFSVALYARNYIVKRCSYLGNTRITQIRSRIASGFSPIR